MPNSRPADAGLGDPPVEELETSREADLEAQLAEMDDRWRRALADFDNLRKRFAGEVDRERALERARVAAAWLPIVDNLELALTHADADPTTIIAGIEAVRDQAVQILERLGFERRDEAGEVGEPFDPARHEAISSRADAAAKPGTVLHVVRPGYGDGERQIRPASVVVATREE